jgi:hypothetical protein
MSQIKAIETFYKGYHFRSRLEARWAVFFETLGIPWKYEVEGYETEVFDRMDMTTHEPISKTVRYLPDFFLPKRWGDGGVYVEVKGDKNALKKNWHEHAEMHDFGGILPDFQDSIGKSDAGLLLLSDIPEASQAKIYFHPIIQHHKGLVKSYAFFDGNSLSVVKDSPLATLLGVEPVYGLDHEEDNWGIDVRQIHTHQYYPKVVDAYAAARAARFEHGQQGTR